MDGHALDVEADSFDVTASQFGLMQEIRDGALALREMVRVTRPAGRVLLVVYGPPDQIACVRLFMDALQAVVRDLEAPPDDPHWASDSEELARRTPAAGLQEVRVATTAERLASRSAVELWDWLVHSSPFPGMLTVDLTEEQQATMRQALDGMLHERSAGQGPAILSNAVNIGIGTK